MKDRGKGVETFNEERFSTSSDMPCRKHPSSSSSSSSSSFSSSSGGGICAFCLRERLFELVCPDCGEQRLSSCSCSDPNSNPDTGGAARISFLIENEKAEISKTHPKILRRSNSSCVAAISNKGGGFWKFGRLFRKRRQKHEFEFERNDSKSEMCVSDLVGVPRSRSLCSFNGGNTLFYDTEESGARVSSVSGGFMMDSAKRSCFSESEARISNFDYDKDLIAKGIFTMREGCEFSCSEDPKFIDLKLNLCSSSSSSVIRKEQPVLKRGGLAANKEFGYGGIRSNEYYGMFKNAGGSCRISERDLKKCRKSRKVWRWFFRASSKLG